MGVVKRFKDWFRKDKVEREVLSLREVKEEVVNTLSYAFDNVSSKLEVYTYYEGDFLTIEIKCLNVPCKYSLISDDFGSFLEYFNSKYTVYDDSFMYATCVEKPGAYKGFSNIPIEKFDDLSNNVYFLYIDIYLDKYKKNPAK